MLREMQPTFHIDTIPVRKYQRKNLARPNRNLGRIALFAHKDDPLRDKPWPKSRHYVEELILNGKAYWLNETSAQLLPPREYLADQRNFLSGGTFDESWKIMPSGGVMPVWQMITA